VVKVTPDSIKISGGKYFIMGVRIPIDVPINPKMQIIVISNGLLDFFIVT